jgi:hypothetical protein
MIAGDPRMVALRIENRRERDASLSHRRLGRAAAGDVGQRVTSSGVYEANNARERLEEVSIAVTKNYFLSEIPQYPYKAE